MKMKKSILPLAEAGTTSLPNTTAISQKMLPIVDISFTLYDINSAGTANIN
jgi:UTP-glucose-1-phosphate uridylyltransferase